MGVGMVSAFVHKGTFGYSVLVGFLVSGFSRSFCFLLPPEAFGPRECGLGGCGGFTEGRSRFDSELGLLPISDGAETFAV